MITLKKMSLEQCTQIAQMDASQYIGRAWREVEGVRTLVTIDYLDPTWPNGYETHLSNLIDTV